MLGAGSQKVGECVAQTSGLADAVGSLELDRLNVLFELLSRSGPFVLPKDFLKTGPFVLPKDSVQTDYTSVIIHH